MCTVRTLNESHWAELWLSAGNKCPCPGWRDGSGSLQLCPAFSHLHCSCTHLPTLTLAASISWDHTRLSALKQSQNTRLLWVLLMCVSVAVVNNAQSSTCLLFCTWENRCETCPISLHLSGPLVLAPRRWHQLKDEEPPLAEGHMLWPSRREKVRGDFQKGQKLQRNEETEIWAVTHCSTGKRRRIKTVP